MNIMNFKTFTIIYTGVSITEIIFGTIGNPMGVYLTKPLIMLLIMLFYVNQTKGKRESTDKVMLLAFFFSMLGDIFLMFEGEKFFMMGLGSFLITHLLYIFIFRKEGKQPNWLSRIAIAIFSIIMLLFIKDQLPMGLFIPVIVYMTAISIMAMSAAERATNARSYQTLLIGALLFMVSDALIALDKFAYTIPFRTLFVMGTYVLAQYLIANGYLWRKQVE
jgi:uncharacterized membrane protein YhhN